jgi:peptide/nickel transport system substrate-binding protein
MPLPVEAIYAAPEKETLTVALEADLRTIDPRYATDANSQYLENLLHCSLISFDKDGRTISDLVDTWSWQDPTHLILTLKDKIKFDDGSLVTIDDVKATYDFFLKEKVTNPSPRRGAFLKLKSITAKNPKTLVFELSEADTTFIQNLVIGILPAKLAAGDMIASPETSRGCGPFKIKATSVGSVELERNPNYSLGPVPKLKSIVIKIVKDETTRLAKLRTGEVDLVQNSIGRDKLESIAKSMPSLKVLRRAGLNTTYLGFNMKDPLVGKVAVRRAVGLGIDRDKIIKYVLQGLAVPATTMLTPDDPFLNKALKNDGFDPKAAAKILDEAGFKDPDGDGPKPRFSLTYKTTTDMTRVAIAKAIASDLRKIGINVSVEPLEWGRFKADVEAGKVQMWSLAWVGFKDPDIYRFAFATESFPPNGGNRGWYSNPTLDKILNQGRTETDVKKRTVMYDEVQKIVAEEVPYVFLWHEEIFAVVSKDVEGFELFADGRYTSLRSTNKK